MTTCKKCFYTSDHPFGLTIDESGVCSGCRVHEEKFQIDWKERAIRLNDIVKGYKSKTNYDCIIPIRSNRDSFFIVDYVTNVLGMFPLLTYFNSEYSNYIGAQNLAKLKTRFNCDILEYHIDPKTLKSIVNATLQEKQSILWHLFAGETTFAIKTSIRFKVPLIIWGHNKMLDQVGMFSHFEEPEMTKRIWEEHRVMGLSPDDLALKYPDLAEHLEKLNYPQNNEIAKHGVRGIYLGNYILWDSKVFTERMIDLHGYKTQFMPNTFNSYEDAGCFHSSGAHDLIKYLKHGYSRIHDHFTKEIRFNRVQKKEAEKYLKDLGLNFDISHLDKLLNFLDLSEDTFFKIIGNKKNLSKFKLHKQNNEFFYEKLHRKNFFNFQVNKNDNLSDEHLIYRRGMNDKFI